MALRSQKQKLGLLVLFWLALVSIRGQIAADDCVGSQTITLTLAGLSEAEASTLQVFAHSPLAKARPLTHLPGTQTWRQFYPFWTHHLRLYVPAELLARNYPVTITIGESAPWKSDTSTLAATWKPVPKPADSASPLIAFDSPPEIHAPPLPLLSRFPPFRGVINGPELAPFGEILGQSLGLLVLGMVAVLLSERILTPRTRMLRLLVLCLRPRAALPQTKAGERLYALLGLGLLLLTLGLLVHGKRYGFVHDDNLTQFFPVMLQGCESLFQGVFPTYNPYQLMGSPTATIGTYALTYPPTYFCYALARWLFRDVYLTLDIFVVVHLVLGYAATFALARRLGLRPTLAMTVALSFVLCGFFCVYTRCWFYMAPVALWTPLILLSLQQLTERPHLSWRWPLQIGIAIGLYFHAGNAQMWTYTLLLCVALVALWQATGRLARGRLLWALAGLLVGLALAAPLLVPQAAEVAVLDREGSVKTGILRGSLALLLPAPLVKVAHPTIENGAMAVWNHLFDFAPLYYCGPVFLGIGLLGLASLSVLRWDRRWVGANAWLLCGGLALVLSLGETGGLAQVLAPLPGFNKFQHWWKFLPFVALFFALGGGMLLEHGLRIRRRGSLAERLVTLLIPSLLAYNAFISQPMMTVPETPYPRLSSSVRRLVLPPQDPPQRGLALAPWLPEWKEPGLVGSLSQNFATLYRVPMLEGYDPLVAKSPLNRRLTDRLYASTTFKRARQDFDPIPVLEPLTALRRYGVHWIFLTAGHEELKGTYALDATIAANAQARLRLPHTTLLEISGSDPLAFVEGAPEYALPIVFDATGVQVALGGTAEGSVVVNLLARERLHAFLDGKPTAITKDSWDRVTVKTPRGAKQLTLRYEPDWRKGFLLSGCLLLGAVGALLCCRRGVINFCMVSLFALMSVFMLTSSIACAQNKSPDTVPVGAGSYTTKLPAGAKEPGVLPFVTAAVKRPIPTNDWWSSLVFSKFSNQMFPHPLGVQAHETGLRIYYPGVGYTANPEGIFTAVMQAPNDLVIGHSAQATFPDARAESWSDWFVTAAFGDKLHLTFGHGSPFVYGTITDGEPTFTFGSTPTVFSGDAKSPVLGVTLGGRSYGLFGPAGCTWKGIATSQFICQSGGKSYFSVALLPDNKPETLAFFAKYAHNHVTDSRVVWSYDEKTSKVTTKYAFTVKAYEGTTPGTLFGLYPHQYQRSTTKLTDYTFQCTRGVLKVAAGEGFTTVAPFQGVLPLLPDFGGYEKATLKKFIDTDAATYKPELADTYWTGKALGKLATLTALAEATGNTAANTALRARLKALLEDYFTAKSGKTKGLFYYNKPWGTLIGYPASYGSDEALNDHHFHYGYFLRAAAELARQEPEWASQAQWGGMVNLLIRDCANPERSDPLFPFLRNFDIYEGHTWADGKGDFADGNNNESSSEAMNAWTGMILWGELTGDKKLRDTGIYLYVTEKDAIDNYWFDVNKLYPKAFTRSLASMVWGAKAVFATWFSGDPIHMHGINLLPLQSGSLYLGTHPAYISENLASLATERIAHDKKDAKRDQSLPPRTGKNWGGWGDVILMYQALTDAPGALANCNFEAQEIESGNSRANFYHWVHFLNKVGQVDTSVSADTPLYAVFKNGIERTYVIYSATAQPRKVTFSNGTVVTSRKSGLTVFTRS